MKKILLTLLVFVTFYAAFGQFVKQGAMMAGGTVSFVSSTDKNKTGGVTVTNGTSTIFSLAPNFGYFLANNLALGTALQLSFGKSDPGNPNYGRSNFTAISLVPFVRYYLNMGIFFQGEFGVGSVRSKSTILGNANTIEKISSSSWSIATGYTIFINENVAIEPMLDYGNSMSRSKSSTIERKSIHPSLVLKLGLQIYLRKK
jgi:hypothetical protein